MILPAQQWALPPQDLALPANTVHLWIARLDVFEDAHRRFLGWLSPDECQRAEKFAFDAHRVHFVNGRGLLRQILGQYLNFPPGQLRFRYTPFGKPELESPDLQNYIFFNLSHSNGVVLFAFAKNMEIGVDIEFIRPHTDIEQSGAIVFSPPEMAAIRALPPEWRRTAFFQFWTRKEAFIKAVGHGFSLPLQQFNVSAAPEKAVENLGSATEQRHFTRWHIQDIQLPKDYLAAIACPEARWTTAFFTLPDLYPF